jgi:hypothetical protein
MMMTNSQIDLPSNDPTVIAKSSVSEREIAIETNENGKGIALVPTATEHANVMGIDLNLKENEQRENDQMVLRGTNFVPLATEADPTDHDLMDHDLRSAIASIEIDRVRNDLFLRLFNDAMMISAAKSNNCAAK